MIQIRDLYKSYANLSVLKGVTLNIEKGQAISIVGPSGAGKSTLLHLIATLDVPDKGSIWINDIDLSTLKNKKLSSFRNQHIGLVFQFHHLLPEFTALENICIPGYINNIGEKECKKRALEWMDLLGISSRANHKPSMLSGGEAQRVAVCRALINNPDVLLADEPSGNLDEKSANDLHQLLLKLNKEFNQTLIVITHNKELAGITDKTYTMKDGLLIN